MKTCPKCGEEKSLDEFREYKGPKEKLYRRKACHSCELEYKARYRQENKDSIKAYRDFYRTQNLEYLREKSREYAKKNLEYFRAKNHERKARLKGNGGNHTKEEIASMYTDQGGLCAYCEKCLGNEYHVDHMIPVSRGGSNDWSNLAIACVSCNLKKNAKTAEEFIEERSGYFVS